MRVLRVLYELQPSGVEGNLRGTAPCWRERGVEIDIVAIGPELGPYAPVIVLGAGGARIIALMRVLRVLYELQPSGVEGNLRGTAPCWRERGVEIDIVAIGPELGPYAPVLAEAGFRIRHLPLLPAARFAPAFLSLIRRERYDVVHVQVERGNILTCLLARIGSPRALRSLHNVWGFEGRLRFERRLQRAFLRRIGVTHVSVSPSVAEAEWRSYRNPTVVLLNCYDDGRYRPPTEEQRRSAREALGVRPDEFAVASVGNCRAAKNHAAVLEALGRLLSDLPVRYLHAGIEDEDGSERRLAERLGVAEATSFLGQVDDVPGILHAADCYVMPSLHEGLANAALEGLACGLPCVLSDVPGLRDLRGLVPSIRWVAPDPEGVAAGLRQVAELDGPERARIGAEAAQATRRHFARERHVSEYLRLYAGEDASPAGV